MRRRSALRGCLCCLTAALGGCAGQLPRATGPRNPPEAPAGQPRETPDPPELVVGTFDFAPDDDGTLRVFGTVVNRGGARRTGSVRVTVRAGGDELVRETDVTVDPGATAEWAVGFDVAHDQFTAGGDITVAVA
jgi:hypothetical protein